ncbi:hypothetical protein ABBQ38_013272 [Trebouxia sp. C0009 RCD-2024]
MARSRTIGLGPLPTKDTRKRSGSKAKHPQTPNRKYYGDWGPLLLQEVQSLESFDTMTAPAKPRLKQTKLLSNTLAALTILHKHQLPGVPDLLTQTSFAADGRSSLTPGKFSCSLYSTTNDAAVQAVA